MAVRKGPPVSRAPWSSILRGNLIAVHLVNKLPACLGNLSFIIAFARTVRAPYPEPIESAHILTSIVFKIDFNIVVV
jgi:hypothetical protein